MYLESLRRAMLATPARWCFQVLLCISYIVLATDELNVHQRERACGDVNRFDYLPLFGGTSVRLADSAADVGYRS